MLEVIKTLDGRTYVKGTDSEGNSGSCVLHTPAWDAGLTLRAQMAAQVEFDAEVDKVFGGITAVAEKINDIVSGKSNPWAVITIGENIEGQQAYELDLDNDGILLRLLDETDGSMLRWINDGTELIAVAV